MDARLLELDDLDQPLIIYKYDEGFWIHIPESTKRKLMPASTSKAMLDFGYSPEMVKLVAICMNQNMRFLRLDCDGEQYDELPSFDW